MSKPTEIAGRMTSQEKVAASLKRRYWAERRFRAYGLAAVMIGVLFVVLLFGTIIQKGHTAFEQAYIQLDVAYPADDIDVADIASADFQAPIRAALRARFPAVTERAELRKLYALVSTAAPTTLQKRVEHEHALIGKHERLWLLAGSKTDMVMKGRVDLTLPEADRAADDQELGWIGALRATGDIRTRFNPQFFLSGDSREPEQAGVLGALVGTFLTLLVTLILSFPIGVAAAVYLEEFARRSRLTDLIEVNINNLAAVPSIVFGLLGLAMFIQFFGMPRSAPLVGGLVLSLMTLPTIIIASRSALKAVPPSIREAALGMGASKVQTVTHHVLPLALPGMLTGAIIGMARALGESAPLLMIGMVAFIVDVPKGFADPSTVLPVQIFLWATSPERAFVERTSGAIIVLLAFLLLMNAIAVVLRSRFERRW